MRDSQEEALFEYLLRLGDDRLVLGHRLSEWCGHGPILEEDIALANIALDLIGQAKKVSRLSDEIERDVGERDVLLEDGAVAAPLGKPVPQDQAIVAQAEQILEEGVLLRAGS